MQQLVHAGRARIGPQVEVGHPPTDERVEVHLAVGVGRVVGQRVVDGVVAHVQSGHHGGDRPAGLVHGEQVAEDVAQRQVPVVRTGHRDLRPGVVQDPGPDRMALGVVRVEQRLG